MLTKKSGSLTIVLKVDFYHVTWSRHLKSRNVLWITVKIFVLVSLLLKGLNRSGRKCVIFLRYSVPKIFIITGVNPEAVKWGDDSYDRPLCPHYNDVIMGMIASQITNLTIVNSIVYSDADQRKHQSSASLAFVQGIHRGPVNSPHKWPVTRKMFPFDDVIMGLQPGPPSQTPGGLGQRYWSWAGSRDPRNWSCGGDGLRGPPA